ncbi:MAG: 1-acyl-sn-glycerol-3-phosphate acyltransferase [Methylococcales bacterium]|jgi:lyso-ornithine lipid O-acyltransferase|nr:1-acyl-sn-glycerol-3-phosphate acyltransferase [Methylococcales bacterium]
MFHYIIKFIQYTANWIDMIFLTIIVYLLSFLPKSLTQHFYFKLVGFWSKFFIRALGVDLKLHQKNIQPIPKQYILIANHPSAFEDIGIPALFNAHSLAKYEVKHWWIVGRISEAAGTLYVKRESKDSRHEAKQQLIDALNNGKSIALYPEGGCKGRRIFESFRYGAFDVSMNTGIPILPVFLHYESQDDFEWRDPQTLIQKLWHFSISQNNQVNYYVYDAIDPEQFSSKEEYTEHVYQLYLKWQARYLD